MPSAAAAAVAALFKASAAAISEYVQQLARGLSLCIWLPSHPLGMQHQIDVSTFLPSAAKMLQVMCLAQELFFESRPQLFFGPLMSTQQAELTE